MTDKAGKNLREDTKKPAQRGRKNTRRDDASTLQGKFGLTDKEAQFVREYLSDHNATQAAIRSGYSAKTAGQQAAKLLKKVKVAEAMEFWREITQERAEITQERVLRELAKLAFADIRNVVSWGDTTIREEVGQDGEVIERPYHGVAVRNSEDIDPDAAAAITEISEGRDGIKVKLADKKGALELLARHMGMLNDKVRLQGDADNPLRILHQQISGTALRPRGDDGDQTD